MLLAAVRRFLVAVIVLGVGTSCRRATSAKLVPRSAAYSDGFEVLVFDTDSSGTPRNVRSLRLAEAEKAIIAGADVLIPADPSLLEKKLSTGKSGDSQASIAVDRLNGGKQQVRLAFHESNRTFVFEYLVEGMKVTPLASSYSDLAKSSSVRYSH